MTNKDFSLEDRMKEYYEHSYRIKLPRRIPVIIRLDGKAFHTLTRKFNKPFDENFIDMMNKTAIYLCQNIQCIQIAYIQSDEISLLLHNYKKLNSESWFDNNIQKIVSVSAGMVSSFFTSLINNKIVVFDSRVFVLPEAEVNNYFLWRQLDATRNSIEMVAQSLFSHKELHKKNCNELQEMIFQKTGKNWNDYSVYLKRGRCIIKKDNNWMLDNEIPLFNKDTNYINKLLEVEEQ